MFEVEDFSVVVKNRAQLPKPWRWEIYRAGRSSPIIQSDVLFESMSAAGREGKSALGRFLKQIPGREISEPISDMDRRPMGRR